MTLLGLQSRSNQAINSLIPSHLSLFPSLPSSLPTPLQAGPDTHTTLRHFLIAGPSQLHDLHSQLDLSHPRGEALQLHKCIVAHSSGRGVFDGSVKVGVEPLLYYQPQE